MSDQTKADRIRALKDDVDELLAYIPDYFRDKWSLDKAATQIKAALDEYADTTKEATRSRIDGGC